ncbi:MAG: hypothetical protein ABIS01_13945, partial [Ferruginibacter sp.]
VMKRQSYSLFNQMSKEQTGELTTMVKETLAEGFYQLKTKTFTAADLWNIQRQVKSRISRKIFS